MRYRVLCGVVALVGALVVAVSAGAAQKTVTVPGTMEWRTLQPNPNGCSNLGFAVFPDREDAVGWQLVAKRGDREIVRSISPPFDDEEYVKYGWRPGEGMHWVQLAYNGRSAFRPVDCGDLMVRLQEIWGVPNPRVIMTLREDAKIVGKVTDTDGDPVKGVTVRAAGAGSDRTDAEGDYEIDVPETTRTYVVTPRSGVGTFRPVKRRVAIRAGQTKRANFRMKAERQISGVVRMGCEGSGSCRVTPVMGVTVRAKGGGRSYTAVTDERGRFKLAVKRGRYQVQPTNSVMKVTPKRTTLDVRRAVKRTTAFETCGLKGGGQSADAKEHVMAPGNWSSSFECDQQIQIAWNPDWMRTIHFRWAGAPTCTVAGRSAVSNRRYWVFGGTAVGQQWQVIPNRNQVNPYGERAWIDDSSDAAVRFSFSADPNVLRQFAGHLQAAGGGQVAGGVDRTIDGRDCRFEMKRANVYRAGIARPTRR